MKVIVVGNQKGGVGKSTVACNLAVGYSLRGKSVLLIDADIQESSLNFRALREKDDIKAIGITKPTIHKDIKGFENFDVVVIDVGGRDSAVFRSAILAASNGALIIPVLPSVYDVWATEDTLKVLQEARTFADIPAYILFNQVIKSNIVKEAEETLRELAQQYSVGVLNSRLHSRVVYRNSVKEGKGVLEMNDKKAIEELESLINEISNIINIA
ncbi:AAA family ATPase [Aquifex aeolicus]|uniref:CobQ/CobB/MinD/ParA nucleotide binding domain-containing protein n=1 Tax=Aquifex aeolicus (strain VF5) TaxID=224324 RepID=O66424_AQUAE|nr:AAA family ATPase [Aquifex aeolicus]AAC07976.1 unknown protein [Aquifex aeolicus VF5]